MIIISTHYTKEILEAVYPTNNWVPSFFFNSVIVLRNSGIQLILKLCPNSHLRALTVPNKVAFNLAACEQICIIWATFAIHIVARFCFGGVIPPILNIAFRSLTIVSANAVRTWHITYMKPIIYLNLSLSIDVVLARSHAHRSFKLFRQEHRLHIRFLHPKTSLIQNCSLFSQLVRASSRPAV